MKTLTLAILAAAALAASSVAYQWQQNKPIEAVKASVRERLKDPNSAQFERVIFNPEKGVGCGYVNAKNSMGGYIGSSHFILFPDGDLRFDPSDNLPDNLDLRIDALQKQLNYNVLAQANCSSRPSSSASPPAK